MSTAVKNIIVSHCKYYKAIVAQDDPKYYKVRGTWRFPMLSMIDTRDKRAVDA